MIRIKDLSIPLQIIIYIIALTNSLLLLSAIFYLAEAIITVA